MNAIVVVFQKEFVVEAEAALWVGVHTLGHLLVAGLVAFVVYEKLGLALLKKTWFNIDLIWMIALVTTGIVVFFV